MEFIEKHPDKPWHWDGISENPNITMEFIEKNIEKIDFNELSKNTFDFENFKKKIIREESVISNCKIYILLISICKFNCY